MPVTVQSLFGKHSWLGATVVALAVTSAAEGKHWQPLVGLADPADVRCNWNQVSDLQHGVYRGSAVVVPGGDQLGDEDLYVIGGIDVPPRQPAKPEVQDQIFRIRLATRQVPTPPVLSEPISASLPRYGHTSETFRLGDQERIVIIGGNNQSPKFIVPTPSLTPSPTRPRPEGGAATPDARELALAQHPYQPLHREEVVGGFIELNPNGGILETRPGGLSPAVLDHASVLITDSVGASAFILVHGGRSDADIQRADVLSTRLLVRQNDGAWTQTTLMDPGPTRMGHSMVWDPLSRYVVLFGGTTDRSRSPSDDLYFMHVPDPIDVSTMSWQPMSASGDRPAPRAFHSAVFDTKNHRMVIYGGESAIGGGIRMNDTRALSDIGAQPKWSLLTSASLPAGLTGTSMTYDSTRGWPLLVGGGRLDSYGQPASAASAVYALVCVDPNAPPEPTDAATATKTATPAPSASTTGTHPATPTPTATTTATLVAPPTAMSTPTAQATPIRRVMLPFAALCRRDDCLCMHSEQEPNESSALAIGWPPLCEDQWVDGWRRDASDLQDVYWLQVREHGLLKVWLEDLAPGLDLDLYLYDPLQPAHPLQISEHRGSQSEDVGVSAVEGHRYVVLVKPVSGTSTQPYRLRWTLDPNWPLQQRGTAR